jgi:nucleotide-binding universal stress UspA family protein
MYAVELFKYEKCEFLIINAYADEVYENTMELSRKFFEQYKEKVKEATDRSLQKVVAEMLERSPNPKHNYEYLSVFDSLIDAANDLSEKENTDVLVMGTKGKSDNRDITFGSETLQVIKYVKCPVLAVPCRYHGSTPENILFPTDYLIPYKRRELKLVSTIAKNFCASLSLLHISVNDKLSHRQLDNREFLESSIPNGQSSFMNIKEDTIEKAINHFVTAHEINMLVMVNSRHSYMENLLYRSTIERIGLQVEIPFLVLQNLVR